MNRRSPTRHWQVFDAIIQSLRRNFSSCDIRTNENLQEQTHHCRRRCSRTCEISNILIPLNLWKMRLIVNQFSQTRTRFSRKQITLLHKEVAEIAKFRKYVDFSKNPQNDPFYHNWKKWLLLFKDKLAGKIFEKFVGLKPKMVSKKYGNNQKLSPKAFLASQWQILMTMFTKQFYQWPTALEPGTDRIYTSSIGNYFKQQNICTVSMINANFRERHRISTIWPLFGQRHSHFSWNISRSWLGWRYCCKSRLGNFWAIMARVDSLGDLTEPFQSQTLHLEVETFITIHLVKSSMTLGHHQSLVSFKKTIMNLT